MNRMLVLSLCFLISSCGDERPRPSSGGHVESNHVEGSIGGHQLQVRSAMFTGEPNRIFVELSSSPDICHEFRQAITVGDSQLFKFELMLNEPIAPGIYHET